MKIVILIMVIEVFTVAVCACIAYILWRIVSNVVNHKKSMVTKAEDHTIEADAIVLNMQQTGHYIQSIPQVRLQMQVQPDKGRSFVAEIIGTFSMDETLLIKTGSRIKVRYHSSKPKAIILYVRPDGELKYSCIPNAGYTVR